MTIKALLPKEDPRLPDAYGVTVVYIGGGEDTLQLSQHRLDSTYQIFECWTLEDECIWIPLANVARMHFDKAFSKVYAIKEDHDRRQSHTATGV